MSSNVTTPAAKSGSMAAHHSFTVSATVATTNPTTVDKKRAIERMALEKSNFVSQQKASAGAAACVV